MDESERWQEALLVGGTSSDDDAENLWLARYVEICTSTPVRDNYTCSDTSTLRNWNDDFQRLLQITSPGQSRRLLLDKLLDELAVAAGQVIEPIVNGSRSSAVPHFPLAENLHGLLSGTYSCGNLIFHFSGTRDLASKMVRHASYVTSVVEGTLEVTSLLCMYVAYRGYKVLVAAKAPISSSIMQPSPGLDFVMSRLCSKLNTAPDEVNLERVAYYGTDHRVYVIPRSFLSVRAELSLRYPVGASVSQAQDESTQELMKDLSNDIITSCTGVRQAFRRHGVPLRQLGHVLTSLNEISGLTGVCNFLRMEMLARTLRQVATVLCSQSEHPTDECTKLLEAVFNSSCLAADIVPLVVSKYATSAPMQIPPGLRQHFVRRFAALAGFVVGDTEVPFPLATVVSSVVSSRVGLDALSEQGTTYPVVRATGGDVGVLLRVRHSELQNAMRLGGGRPWQPEKAVLEECIRAGSGNTFTLSFLMETGARLSDPVDAQCIDESICAAAAAVSTTHEKIFVAKMRFRKILHMPPSKSELQFEISQAMTLLKDVIRATDESPMLLVLQASVLFPEESMARLEWLLEKYGKLQKQNVRKRHNRSRGRGASPSPVSLCSDEPVPQRAPKCSSQQGQRQLVPLTNPPRVQTTSGARVRSLPGLCHVSDFRGSRGNEMQRNERTAERDYKWWLSKNRLLQNKLSHSKRLSERRNEASEKRQLVLEQQRALSQQLELNNDLAKQNLQQKQEYIRLVRGGQREAVRESRQRLFSKKNEVRAACAEESESHRVMKETLALEERRTKVESAAQVKMRRLAAAQDRSDRQLVNSALSSSIFDERIQNRLLQQRHYEEETHKLVKNSALLLGQIRGMHDQAVTDVP